MIGKANGKSWHSIGNPAVNVEAGTSVRLKVVAKDSHFSVFVGTNPQPVYEFTDSDYARGTIGVREYGQPKAVRGLPARGFGHMVKSFIRRILIPSPPNRAIELGAPVEI